MEPATLINVHSSRYPARIRAAYLESFRKRQMNHQFHYDTEKQSQQWLAIHEAYSPARRDQDTLATYQTAFTESALLFTARPLTLLSLGCGGGQKDLALLSAFRQNDQISYLPTDVSLSLALISHFAARSKFPQLNSEPANLDLKEAANLNELLPPNAARVILLFGMLPNFEPHEVLPQLSAALRPGDYLLISANLAPDYDLQKILPQYENELTRRWLATVLLDAGLDLNPSDLEFQITDHGPLKRIEAGYRFQTSQTIKMDQEQFTFQPNEWFQLFFSYRHTPALVRQLFAPHQIEISQQWVTKSGEEGIFLLKKRQLASHDHEEPPKHSL